MASNPYVIKVKLDVQDRQELQRMIKELQDLAGDAPKVAAATNQISRGFKQTQIEARRTGRIVQNVGYQFQDLIVQISGGVDPIRSLGQQLPQMVIGFGKWGAIIGVVAAALPVLVTVLNETGLSIEEVEKAVEDLQKAMDAFDTEKFVKEFNEATDIQENFLVQNYRIALAELEKEIADSQDMIREAFGNMIGGGAQAAAGTGLDPAIFARNYQLIRRIAEEGGTILEDNIKLRDIYIDQIESEEGLSEMGRLRLKQLQDIILAQEKIDRMREQSLQEVEVTAERVGPSGKLEAQQRREAAAAAREYAAMLRELQAAYASLYPQQTKFFQAVQTANTQLEAGMITLEEYLMRTKAAAQEQGLIGAEETDRIAKLFEESEKMGRDPANNKIAESMTIATESTQIFLDTFEAAADGVARGTQDMSQAFESMAKSIILQIAKLLATQGIGMFLSGQGGFLGDVGTALLTNAKGNAFSDGNVVPMAKGGVVTGPTLFPMANGVGLMGEKGAEAVMPLSRDSSGRLGVSGGGMNVTVNNMAAGVEVTPRQDDDGLTIDVVLASVAADVRRGGNVVSEAIEQTYSMGRGRGVY